MNIIAGDGEAVCFLTWVPCYAIHYADPLAVATGLPYLMTEIPEKRRYIRRSGATEFYLL